jgi:hypothetical protein
LPPSRCQTDIEPTPRGHRQPASNYGDGDHGYGDGCYASHGYGKGGYGDGLGEPDGDGLGETDGLAEDLPPPAGGLLLTGLAACWA